MATFLTPDQVSALLADVLTALDHNGQPACVYVIGGAAIALENPDRIATNDIDGYIRDSATRQIIDATDILAPVQAKWGLEADWFNFHAHGLGPPVSGPEMFHEVMRVGDAILYIANTDALLAMKLNAARGKDMADLKYLLNACKITTLEEAEEVFERYYPGDALSDTATDRVQLIFGSEPPTQ
jgi:hypothetical protein